MAEIRIDRLIVVAERPDRPGENTEGVWGDPDVAIVRHARTGQHYIYYRGPWTHNDGRQTSIQSTLSLIDETEAAAIIEEFADPNYWGINGPGDRRDLDDSWLYDRDGKKRLSAIPIEWVSGEGRLSFARESK